MKKAILSILEIELFWHIFSGLMIAVLGIFVVYNLVIFFIPIDRKGMMDGLGASEYIDHALTDALLDSIKNNEYISIGEDNENFKLVIEKFDSMFLSSGTFERDNINFSNGEEGISFIDKYILDSPSKFILFFSDYILYVFPEIILAFGKKYRKTGFLAAYKLEALDLAFSKTTKINKEIVYEKNKYNLEYYEKYNSIFDSKIISVNWLYVNKDGSRNLRFSPQNNPLVFYLEYGKITIKFGNYSIKKAFSRCNDVKSFVTLFNSYKLSRLSEVDDCNECNTFELIETKNIRKK